MHHLSMEISIATKRQSFFASIVEKKENEYKNIYINFIKGVCKSLNNRFKNSFSEQTFLQTSHPSVLADGHPP